MFFFLNKQSSRPKYAKKSCMKLFVKLHWNSKISEIPRFCCFHFSSHVLLRLVAKSWGAVKVSTLSPFAQSSWLSPKLAECKRFNKAKITSVIRISTAILACKLNVVNWIIRKTTLFLAVDEARPKSRPTSFWRTRNDFLVKIFLKIRFERFFPSNEWIECWFSSTVTVVNSFLSNDN